MLSSRLRILLEQDEQKHRQALLENEGSNESRIQMMRSRMTKLREARERDRQKVVEQKLEQQWRYVIDQDAMIRSDSYISGPLDKTVMNCDHSRARCW